MHPELTALSDQEIEKRLVSLPGWTVQDKALTRVNKFPTYKEALDFVYKVGTAAEENDHHPDIIMNFKTVTVRYWTHSVNGISDLDFKMAVIVEKLIGG